jgi:hypothetical protein
MTSQSRHQAHREGRRSATFAIGAPQHHGLFASTFVRSLRADENQYRRWTQPGICCVLGIVESVAKPQLSASKPKVRGRVPLPFSLVSPVFLQAYTLYWGCRFAGYGNK